MLVVLLVGCRKTVSSETNSPEPEPEAASASPAPSEKELRMCEHLAQLQKVDLEADGMNLSQEMVDDFRDVCLEDLPSLRQQLGDAAYEAKVECLLAVTLHEDAYDC